jgi:hypothetical protein
MDAGWFCWIISLNTTGTRTIFSTRAYTKWYKHSLHIPEMPTIAHLCEFHDLPSWMLGHSAGAPCSECLWSRRITPLACWQGV